jgi:hypothetical protein
MYKNEIVGFISAKDSSSKEFREFGLNVLLRLFEG